MPWVTAHTWEIRKTLLTPDFWPDPALAIAVIWDVNLQMEELCACERDFSSKNKLKKIQNCKRKENLITNLLKNAFKTNSEMSIFLYR